MQRGFELPEGCDWVNYVRCHDDIGWVFSDDDVRSVGFDPVQHRRFLNQFFTGRSPDSFARGAPFQEDLRTGEARVSGSCASLAGVERALAEDDEAALDLAVRRVLMIHGVVILIGGIPLLYLGDEVATLNDYDYDDDPETTGDSRWMHRPVFDWEGAELRRDGSTVPGRVYQGLLRIIQLRRQNPVFARSETEIAETGNPHVFGFLRSGEESIVFVLANFSERTQKLEARRLRQMGMRKTMVDLHAGRVITATQELEMAPYQLMVLTRVA
jgi:amylosucrase/maltose alpha-D-glucosyltransferase/alpha-amylase